MNLIKQFMKIGGLTLPELEAYGEENFFRDFPEAKKLAMGGTPEAFPQIATADKFFSYGVPVPPTYHRDGGATGLPNIYPQIQSEQQFFVPTYSNSNNAYKAGGSYGEAFPQAVSFPNHGWGKTNYFMLESGGSFPPGMPQYTGMLPVMQSGSELAGIDSRTQEDMNHYYGTPYPMMAGGQPSLQAGGQPTGTGKDSFYTDKMQNFIGKIQNNGQKALMKSIELVDEAPPMSGMRYGGIPKYQSNTTSGQYDLTDLAPGSIMIDPNNPNYKENLANYDRSYGLDGLGIFDTPSAGTGSGSAPAAPKRAAPKATAPVAKPKSNTTTSGGVSTSTNTKARTTEELKAEVEAEKKKQESGTTAAGTTGTSGSSSAPAATGTTGTTGTTPTGWEGWRMVELNDGSGRRVPVDSSGRMYFDVPYQSGPQYYQYPQGYTQRQQQANYGNFLDYIPGGGLRRKSANALLGYALSGVDLRGYIPTNIQTRSALLPGNRIKSFDLVKQGVGQGPYRATMPTESAKTTQVPAIQDPNTFQSAMPAMTTDQKVQTAYDWNYRPNQPSYAPAGPVIGPEGPVKQPSMMSAGNTDFDYSSFPQSNPSAGTQVNTGSTAPVIQNPNTQPATWNPQFDEARMLGQISDNEAKYFATQQPNSLDMDWRNQQVVGDPGLYSGQRGVDAWKNKVMNDPAKKNIWNSYSDIPAPLKDIAGDHLFNASSDPRIFTLAAAGAIDMKDSKKYKNDPKLLEATWNQNKGLIQQQYNDDPQAFTSSVSDYRNILYAKSRTKDVNGVPTDLPSNSGTPGLQYNAWSGRTGATQDYIDQAYFGPNTGYVAPQFFMKHGGPYALPMFQSTDFSGEKSNIFSAEMPPFDGAVTVNAEANNTQNMYWDTGVNDFMNQQAREIEKEADPFKAEDKTIKNLKIKRKGLFADVDPDQMIAGIDSLTGFLQKFRPRQKPMTALDVYGSTQSPVGEGSYVTNPSGIGLHFRPNDGNPNVSGMYAYDLPVTQYGGQPFYYADTYYMTMPTIKNVKKAGAYKFGK